MVVNPDAFVHEAYIPHDNGIGLLFQPFKEPIVPLLLENYRENHESGEDARYDKKDFHTVRAHPMNARQSSTASVTRIAVMVPSCWLIRIGAAQRSWAKQFFLTRSSCPGAHRTTVLRNTQTR